MESRYDLLVLDLDGTLIDSSLDLALAVNATRKRFDLDPLSLDQVAGYVGNGAEMLIRRSLQPDATDRSVQDGLQFFLQYYRENMLVNTKLYPGVREALEIWRAAGKKMAVLTNKPVRFSQDLVAGLGIADYFARVYGGNSFETKKPDPFGLNRIMQELRVMPARTLMIGDSSVDVQTARNAGTTCAGVTFGLRPQDFERYPPDALVDDLREIVV